MMEEQNSILDKVIESKRSHSLFQPAEIIQIMADQMLDGREQEILRQRFGLSDKTYTLDAIGKRLGITRERVRQIAKQAISKLETGRKDFPELRQLDLVLKEILEKSGGVREEESLLSEYFDSQRDEVQEAHLLFFLNHLSELIQPAGFKKPSWRLIGAPVDLHSEVEAMVHEFLKQQEEPLSVTEVHEHLKTRDDFTAWKERFFNSWSGNAGEVDWEYLLTAYLELSHKLASNPFNEWGPANSPFVRPRRMGDKIYLVLRKNAEPLHFNKITQLINEYGFDKKPAYDPTVHNELILDDRFVLVGRGIYALSEWGYKEGTVADVLERVLKNSEQPLGRDALIDAVLKERVVKEGTIVLALNDKARFIKNDDGTYSIVVQSPSFSEEPSVSEGTSLTQDNF